MRDGSLGARLRQSTSKWLERRFGVDPRALAAVRVALGALVVADTGLRARHLVAFYADSGVLPLDVLAAEFPVYRRFSLHALSGAPAWQALLFGLTAVAGTALLLGYRTRLATATCLVLVVSVHLRNPLVINAGDKLFRRLLFWGLFLPLADVWSVGSSEANRRADGSHVASLATAGLLLQVVAVYAVNAAIKLRGRAWREGEAVRLVFELDQFTILLGEVVANRPAVLSAMHWLWLGLLVCSPGLILLGGRSRALLAGAFVTAHLGMALSLQLGLFPLIAVAALLPFFPERVWDAVEAVASRGRTVAVERLPRGSPGDRRLRPVRDRLDGDAAARPRVGSLRSPVPPATRKRVRTVLIVAALAFLLTWNGVAIGAVDAPGDAERTVRSKSWDMFAPAPVGTDGWFRTPTTLDDGRTVDALRGGPTRTERPDELAATFPSARWRKYLMGLRFDGTSAKRDALAAHLCSRTDGAERVTVEFRGRETSLDGTEPIERVRIASTECSSGR